MKQDVKNILESYLSIYYEQDSVLIQRRTPEERQKNYEIAIAKQIQEYIKKGSEGNLDFYKTSITKLPDGLKSVGGNLNLRDTPITKLPDGLRVDGNLVLSDTPIAKLFTSKRYTKEQIKQMYPGVKGDIYF